MGNEWLVYWINVIYFSGVLISLFYGLLALKKSDDDDDVDWNDIGIIILMSLLFSWSSALAFFVGFNKNKDKV